MDGPASPELGAPAPPEAAAPAGPPQGKEDMTSQAERTGGEPEGIGQPPTQGGETIPPEQLHDFGEGQQAIEAAGGVKREASHHRVMRLWQQRPKEERLKAHGISSEEDLAARASKSETTPEELKKALLEVPPVRGAQEEDQGRLEEEARRSAEEYAIRQREYIAGQEGPEVFRRSTNPLAIKAAGLELFHKELVVKRASITPDEWEPFDWRFLLGALVNRGMKFGLIGETFSREEAEELGYLAEEFRQEERKRRQEERDAALDALNEARLEGDKEAEVEARRTLARLRKEEREIKAGRLEELDLPPEKWRKFAEELDSTLKFLYAWQRVLKQWRAMQAFMYDPEAIYQRTYRNNPGKIDIFSITFVELASMKEVMPGVSDGSLILSKCINKLFDAGEGRLEIPKIGPDGFPEKDKQGNVVMVRAHSPYTGTREDVQWGPHWETAMNAVTDKVYEDLKKEGVITEAEGKSKRWVVEAYAHIGKVLVMDLWQESATYALHGGRWNPDKKRYEIFKYQLEALKMFGVVEEEKDEKGKPTGRLKIYDPEYEEWLELREDERDGPKADATRWGPDPVKVYYWGARIGQQITGRPHYYKGNGPPPAAFAWPCPGRPLMQYFSVRREVPLQDAGGNQVYARVGKDGEFEKKGGKLVRIKPQVEDTTMLKIERPPKEGESVRIGPVVNKERIDLKQLMRGKKDGDWAPVTFDIAMRMMLGGEWQYETYEAYKDYTVEDLDNLERKVVPGAEGTEGEKTYRDLTDQEIEALTDPKLKLLLQNKNWRDHVRTVRALVDAKILTEKNRRVVSDITGDAENSPWKLAMFQVMENYKKATETNYPDGAKITMQGEKVDRPEEWMGTKPQEEGLRKNFSEMGLKGDEYRLNEKGEVEVDELAVLNRKLTQYWRIVFLASFTILDVKPSREYTKAVERLLKSHRTGGAVKPEAKQGRINTVYNSNVDATFLTPEDEEQQITVPSPQGPILLHEGERALLQLYIDDRICYKPSKLAQLGIFFTQRDVELLTKYQFFFPYLP